MTTTDTTRTASGLALPAGEIVLATGRTLRPMPIPAVAGMGAHAIAGWRALDGLTVIAAIEPYRTHGAYLHVSLSRPDRLPSWKELRAVKDAFFGPEIDAMVVLPKQRDYVNAHPFCHHLWEMPQAWETV